MGSALPDRDVEHYREHGYVFPVPILSPDEVSTARSRLEAAEAERGGALEAAERSKSHLLFTWVDELMRHPRILDSLDQLIGPDILCWNTIFWIKEPHTPTFVGWHQDLTYWGLDNDELVSVWVALSPATVESGCMSVLPGSHREFLSHNETYDADNMLTRGQDISLDVDESKTVAMELAPGEASFHNVKSAHGSGPNSSDDRRIGLSMHYMPTHTRQTLADWDTAALVRGEDRHNHFRHTPRPRFDMDPEAVAFHEEAAGQLRKIVYAGAEPPSSPTL